MIGLSIGLGDRRLLLVVNHFRGGLLRHLYNGYVGRRRCHQNVTFYLRITGDARDLVSITRLGVRSGSSVESSKRLEGESEK
jgi:hypothetical protein